MALFLACGTQWRTAGMDGMPLGLDYGGVREVAAMMGLELTPEVFRGLQVMELAAVGVWAEKRRQRLKALERK